MDTYRTRDGKFVVDVVELQLTANPTHFSDPPGDGVWLRVQQRTPHGRISCGYVATIPELSRWFDPATLVTA
jgi:hypothetical protein